MRDMHKVYMETIDEACRVKFIVQATYFTKGAWADSKKAISMRHAEMLRKQLINNPDAWMNNPTIEEREAMTRIVPVEEANCKY